jgi:hypothetical protein
MREKEVSPAMPDNNGNTHNDEIKQQNLSNRAVTRYLDWLAGKRPAPRSTTRTVEGELAKVDERLGQSDLSSTKRLKLLQDRRNLQIHGLPSRRRPPTEDRLVDGFITHGAAYADIHAISYETFLEFGVPAEILDKANIRP